MVAKCNDIAARQNDGQFLEFQAAKNWLYDRARLVSRVQAWLAVVGPLVLATVKLVDPGFSPWAALYAVFALLLEPELDDLQERLRSHAARVQERFDRELFGLPWPTGAIGPQPSDEDVRRWGRRYRARMSTWKDWYPPQVSNLPLAVARLACQRTNGFWDSALRDRYATGLSWAGLIVVGAVLVAGLARGMTVLEMVTLGVFLTPVFRWLQRTARRQRSSATSRRRLFEWAISLCEDWQSGRVSDESLTLQAAEIQRETFEQRKTSPMIPRWLY
ncbi:MAG: S-4TM family putative pore-forming effector, partial [bacterium]